MDGVKTIDNPELALTHIFNAPRELVFKCWTDPELAKNWWGPRHHPAIHLEMDARAGGTWKACLKSVENGRELWHRGTFREINEPERIVFTFKWDEEGERGIETVVTLTFSEHNGQTHMNFLQTPFQSIAECEGHNEGWTSAFGRLEDLLVETR